MLPEVPATAESPRHLEAPGPSVFPSLLSEAPTFAEPPRPLPLPLCSSAERPSTAPEIPVFAEFPRPETPGHSSSPAGSPTTSTNLLAA